MTITNKILLFIIIITCSCSSINTIHYKRIDAIELDEIKTLYSYKGVKLSGIYRIKRGYKNDYTIENFNNGLLDGERKIFRENRLYQVENYQNGILNGPFVMYYDGIKKTQYNCEDGLPNGEKIIFTNNGQDTLSSLIYVTTPSKMDIFADSIPDIKMDKIDNILFAIQPGILKTDQFIQSYYSKKDSVLFEKIIWVKDEYNFYRRKL